MSDEVFAEILEGLAMQKHCRRITYRRNELGPKSAEWLLEICNRSKANDSVQELTLSEVKVMPNDQKDELSFLAQLTQAVETVQKCGRINFSGTDLSDPEVTQNLYDIVSGMGYVLRWVDISYCRIPLKAMLEISSGFAACDKLDYLNIAGNLIAKSRRKIVMPTEETAPKQKKKGEKAPVKKAAAAAKPSEEDFVVAEVVENITKLLEL